MGLFDFVKKKTSNNQDEKNIGASELRSQRMAESRSVISRGAVKDAPGGFDHFNLNDFMIVAVNSGVERYLFAGDNAAVLNGDMLRVNQIVAEANRLVPGLPDLSIQSVEIAFDPFPDTVGQTWLYSRLIVENRTETGRLKKYPVSVVVETITGEKAAKLYYTLDGAIGKGSVWIHLNKHKTDFVSYGTDFINGALSHVWKSDCSGKKVQLYNKNEYL